jgi:transcriptional regulator with XRE-family HTH domain
MDIREVFALNLRRARNAKGLSQEGLAHEADVDRTYVSALERSKYSATIDMVDKLAKASGVTRARYSNGRRDHGSAGRKLFYREGSRSLQDR